MWHRALHYKSLGGGGANPCELAGRRGLRGYRQARRRDGLQAKSVARQHTTVARVELRRPALPYSTHIRAEAQGGWTYEAGSVSTELELPRQSTAVARLQTAAIDSDSPIDEPGERRREEHLSDWHRRVTYVET